MKTKTKFKFYTIAEYQKEEKWLREQHNSGWKFKSVTFPGFYHFEECVPQDVVYRLDYNEEGLQSKDEYTQIFSDCGWSYITEFAGYSYFTKAADDIKSNENDEIFSDDESKLDMTKRVFKGRMLPMFIIFFCIIIPQLFMQMPQRGTLGKFIFWLYLGLFGLYTIIFAMMGIMYLQLKKKVLK